jgi:Mg2+ and Co2+ transporter CorA
LKDLLDLKQQQASIIEAKSALARADESVTQGRAIMMFTIITIIFLPLSFMSSVFGMNALELSGASGGIMSLRYQFKFMCKPHPGSKPQQI